MVNEVEIEVRSCCSFKSCSVPLSWLTKQLQVRISLTVILQSVQDYLKYLIVLELLTLQGKSFLFFLRIKILGSLLFTVQWVAGITNDLIEVVG
jgi:hypothetical protein